MALTLLSKPKRWSAAHLPLQFAFSYIIDARAVGDNAVRNYICIGITQNRNSYFGIYPSLFAGKFTVGQKFYIGTDTFLIQDKPVTVTESYQGTVLSGGTNYPVTYYKIDYKYDAQYPNLYLYSIDYVRTIDATFQLYINNDFIGNIRYYREFSSGQLIVDISAELASSFGEIQTPIGSGVDNNCFRKYRLDYGIGAAVTTGIDFYAVNSVIQPLNPACSDTLPNWQFDLTTLTCENSAPSPIFGPVTSDPNPFLFQLKVPNGTDISMLKIGDVLYFASSTAVLFSGIPYRIDSIYPNTIIPYFYIGFNHNPVDLGNTMIYLYKELPFVNRITGNRIARKKDINPLSATYNQYANSGQYFFYDVNKIACSITYYSSTQAQQFRKNDCSSGVGLFVNYTVAANTYTSIISQLDADNKALADIAANGQTYANTNGVCGSLHIYVETRNSSYIYTSNDGSFHNFGDIYLVLKDNNGLPVSKTLSVNINKTIIKNGNTFSSVDSVVNVTNASEILLEANLDFENSNGTDTFNTIYSVLSGTGYVNT